MLELSYPLKEGIVNNWEDMEKVWDYAFSKKLGIDNLGERNILLTEAACNPTKNRQKMAEVMFEKFGFQGVRFSIQAVLSLFSQGMTSGLVMDSGDGVSHTIPVWDGHVFEHQIGRLNVAGRHVTEHLIKLLLIRGYAFNSSADFETVRNLKEKFGYIAYDIERERTLARDTCIVNRDYVLPNNKVIRIGRERFEAGECLFNPGLIDNEKGGIPDLIFDTINSCPMDCKKKLYSTILLTGGSTMFPGFPT
jgi:actin-related protein 2